MNEYSIQSSDDIELKFNGALIHQDESTFSLDDSFDRKFSATVYAVDGGGFVASIEFQSNCPREKSVLWFEQLDSFEDVEKFYYVFDTAELTLPTNELSRDDTDVRDRISKSISKRFDKLMFQFLEDLKSEAEFHHFGDRVVEPTKATPFWGLFKTK